MTDERVMSDEEETPNGDLLDTFPEGKTNDNTAADGSLMGHEAENPESWADGLSSLTFGDSDTLPEPDGDPNAHAGLIALGSTQPDGARQLDAPDTHEERPGGDEIGDQYFDLTPGIDGADDSPIGHTEEEPVIIPTPQETLAQEWQQAHNNLIAGQETQNPASPDNAPETAAPETQTKQPGWFHTFLHTWLIGETSWLNRTMAALRAGPNPDEPPTATADETTAPWPTPEIDADDNSPANQPSTSPEQTEQQETPPSPTTETPSLLDSEEWKNKPVQRLNLTVSSFEQKTSRWTQEERNKKQNLVEQAFNFHADKHISADDYLARVAKLRTANNQLQEPDSNTTAPDNSTIEPELT